MNDPTSEYLDLLAYWWLPERSDRRVPGRLTWDPDNGGDLELIGELREPQILDNHLPSGEIQKYRAGTNETDRSYSIIHGSRITKSGFEEAYTLLRSFSLNGPGPFGLAEYPEHITCGAVLHGAWYTDPADIEADRAIFSIRHLSTWVDNSGLETKWPALEGDTDGPHTVIKGRRLPAFSTTHDGAEVRLQQTLEHTGDHKRASGIQQDWQLVLACRPTGELESFADIATDIRALVTIASGRAADIEKAVLQHPQLHQHRLDGTPAPAFRDDITYLNRWAHRGKDSSALGTHELYFTLGQFGGPDGIQRWLQTAQAYRTELRRVMATRYTDSMYLEDRIMNTCAALERFDKVRRRKSAPKVLHDNKLVDPWFVDRIKECVEYAGPEFKQVIVEDPRSWAERVRNARNQLAHHDDPFRATGQVGEHILAEQIYWLFVLCMLRACRAPQATFEGIRNHLQVQWLTDQAKDHFLASSGD